MGVVAVDNSAGRSSCWRAGEPKPVVADSAYNTTVREQFMFKPGCVQVAQARQPPNAGAAPEKASQMQSPVSASVEAKSPFGKQHVLDITATITNDTLNIRVNKTRYYAAIAPNYPFYNVMEGLGTTGSKDTDSLQVAVRWTDTVGGGGTDVGHKTNAVPWIDSVKKSVRQKGANWERGGVGKEQWVSWEYGEVPSNAKHLDIVFVYTDVFLGNPSDWGQSNKGDLPVIVGSFSADLEDNKWAMKPITEEKPWHDYFPDPNSYPEIYEKVKITLKDKTGYDLKPRPKALLQTIDGKETWIYKPGLTKEFNAKWIKSEIRKAVTIDKAIRDEHDTGFDIIPQK